MLDGELTIHDVLNDQVMQADGISSGQLRRLLHEERKRHLTASCRDMRRSDVPVSAVVEKEAEGRRPAGILRCNKT
ncbi:hypothetical protein RP75_19150 [Agrobacterium arsenijevicii]|uniref:Uncharacterized protein n=1 Tax=Agrobacterium arsenijevicii TaxID=1585697 RepID=A0ABR5D3N0_9HYPH|nr:hypothetical protein RP75_19150 [Agrobacterium arsenijevicii]